MYEARVVADLAAVAGVRLRPSAAALRDFAQRAAPLDPLLLCCLLQQQLAAPDDQWASKLRLLHGIKVPAAAAAAVAFEQQQEVFAAAILL